VHADTSATATSATHRRIPTPNTRPTIWRQR
jgi:hypothetical protein